MSKERELLAYALDRLKYINFEDDHLTNDLIQTIQKLLNQPDINTQYLLDQVSRLTAENAMLKEKWLAQPEQEPLTGIEISNGFNADDEATHPYSYWAGINFAEKCHGIGGEE